MREEDRQKIETLAEALNGAERILIGAGAGLSAAAGLSYFDEEVFRTWFPALLKEGYRCQYNLVGFGDEDWSLGRKWAYWATHVHYVREVFPSAPLYHELLALLQGRDWFVVTSNADRQFFRAGFPMERVFEYQGSYDNMGCSVPCGRHTWNSLEPLARAREFIDPETFTCAPEGIPRCPVCGAPAEMCFRPENYAEGRDRYVDFVNGSEGKRLVLVELGVGFNTPGVIRWPFERICRALPEARLFRVNRGYLDYPGHKGYPTVPPELGERAMAIDCDAAEVITALREMQGVCPASP